MVQLSTLLSIGLSTASLVSAAPAVSAAVAERAVVCTFSGASGAAAAIKAKNSCATITLNNLVVPAGTTLDLTKLNKGTSVSRLVSSPMLVTFSNSSTGYLPGNDYFRLQGVGRTFDFRLRNRYQGYWSYRVPHRWWRCKMVGHKRKQWWQDEAQVLLRSQHDLLFHQGASLQGFASPIDEYQWLHQLGSCWSHHEQCRVCNLLLTYVSCRNSDLAFLLVVTQKVVTTLMLSMLEAQAEFISLVLTCMFSASSPFSTILTAQSAKTKMIASPSTPER